MYISVPECGIDGNAEVLRIDDCPPIKPGSGCIVTGTFRHSSADVIDIQVDGSREVIGTTGAHPFWSEDRMTFVRADALQPGEELRTANGGCRIATVTPRRVPACVYNIEVYGEHVYHVGELGILVHNGNGGPCPRRLQEAWDAIEKAGNWAAYSRPSASGDPVRKGIASFSGTAGIDNVFLSGYGTMPTEQLSQLVKEHLGALGKFSQSGVTRMEEMTTFWEDVLKAPLSSNAAHDAVYYVDDLGNQVKKVVPGAAKASHGEMQAAWVALTKTSDEQLQKLVNWRNELVINIRHPTGPCIHCMNNLAPLAAWAKKQGSRSIRGIRIVYEDTEGKLTSWFTNGAIR